MTILEGRMSCLRLPQQAEWTRLRAGGLLLMVKLRIDNGAIAVMGGADAASTVALGEITVALNSAARM